MEPVEIEFEQSHKHSFAAAVKGGFKLTLTPSGAPHEIRGVHYVLLVDASYSMAGEKIEAAKRAAAQLVERLPDGNIVSIVAFGGSVRTLAERVALGPGTRAGLVNAISKIIPDNGTPLYTALLRGLELAGGSRAAYLILLSDGQPTDVSDPARYRALHWPPNVKAVSIGVGLDYNPELMNLIADLGNGLFFHVSELNVEELVEKIVEVAAARGSAVDVRITLEDLAGGARFIGYTGNEVTIPVLRDEHATIYGEVTIPAMHEGPVARLRVSYVDPASDKRVEKVFEYTVTPARSREEFLAGIDNTLLAEVRYHSYMEDVKNLLARGNLAEATQRLARAEDLAKATMRLDLIEQTRSLRVEAERTMRLGDASTLEEVTRRLSEKATRTLRRA